MNNYNIENKDAQIELLLESNRLMAKQIEELKRKKSSYLITIGVCHKQPDNGNTGTYIYKKMVSEDIKILSEIQDEKGRYGLIETAADYFSDQGLNIIRLVEQAVLICGTLGCFTFLVEPTDEPPRKFYRSLYYGVESREIINSKNRKYGFNAPRIQNIYGRSRTSDTAYYSTVK